MDTADKFLDEWEDGENRALSSIIRNVQRVSNNDEDNYLAAALAFCSDFRALDYYMRNGRIPTAWRN